MYDMTKLRTRFWEIRLRNGKKLSVEAPKMKVLKKIASMSDISEENFNDEDVDNLEIALAMALSKNKENYKITKEWIEENLSIDEVQNILTEYFNWVNSIKNSKN